MKVTLERLPASRVQLDIEVDQDRLEPALEAAYRRLAQRARIPGFRPGKAPRQLVERAYGREGLIREALDKLVPDVYNETIEKEDVDAIAQPELEILELEPVRFKATVAVRPTVDLGDYGSIRVEKNPVEVTDEQVDEQVMLLRRRFAERVAVERPARWDDILTADVHGVINAAPVETEAAESADEAAADPEAAANTLLAETAEGEPFVEDDDAEFALREGQTLLVPGLSEAFLGMSAGEEKTVEIAIPDDFRVERLQGKTASFTLTVKGVKEEQLPEEDDDLAGKVEIEEVKTLPELRERIRTDLQRNKEQEEQTRVRNEAVDKLVESATMDYPVVMVEREIDTLVRETTGDDRQSYMTYLQRVGRSEADFRETWREAADLRVRRALALGQLADTEAIDVSLPEVEEELDRLTEPMGEEKERFRQMFMNAEGLSTIRRNLLSQRTLERLEAIATGEAPAAAPATAASSDSEPAEPAENGELEAEASAEVSEEEIA
ncbi:MAG: trigger factor [Chloroflexi bacterium]|nr:trigger factor [Chloroflexota bacterium]